MYTVKTKFITWHFYLRPIKLKTTSKTLVKKMFWVGWWESMETRWMIGFNSRARSMEKWMSSWLMFMIQVKLSQLNCNDYYIYEHKIFRYFRWSRRINIHWTRIYAAFPWKSAKIIRFIALNIKTQTIERSEIINYSITNLKKANHFIWESIIQETFGSRSKISGGFKISWCRPESDVKKNWRFATSINNHWWSCEQAERTYWNSWA